MFEPIVNFFSRIFFLIGRSIGLVIAWTLWPFIKVAAWYRSTGFLWQAIVGLILLTIVAGYGWFIYNSVTMPGYDPDYVTQFDLKDRKLSAGEVVTSSAGGSTTAAIAANETEQRNREESSADVGPPARRLARWFAPPTRCSRIGVSPVEADCSNQSASALPNSNPARASP